MSYISFIWNNPVTRWLAGALAVVAIFVLTYMAGSSNGKRKEKAENKVKALEKRIKIEEAQDGHVDQANSIRTGNDDDDSVPVYHTRPD